MAKNSKAQPYRIETVVPFERQAEFIDQMFEELYRNVEAVGTGTTGATGATGARGPMGPPGVDSDEGPEGAMGLMGPMGPAGAMGAMGPIGLMGPPGVDGGGEGDGSGGDTIIPRGKETDFTLADNTVNDVSILRHGFAPKAPNDATRFLNGVGGYSVPSGGSFNYLLAQVYS